MSSADPRAVLVSMPWGNLQEPALGLSLLAASLRGVGIDTGVLYLQHRLLRHLSDTSYRRLGDVFALNDFVFGAAFEPDMAPEQHAALAEICDMLWSSNPAWRGDPRFADAGAIAAYALRLRNEVIPAYLDECLAAVMARRPTLVAFSCLFDQTIASLALAQKIRAADPSVRIVMGGYALAGPTGPMIARAFDCVDAVVQGPGEAQIIAEARHSVRAAPDPEPRRVVVASLPITRAPLPDFTDFEAELQRLERVEKVSVDWRVMPYECSRGCWWGQKNHCIFCGIASDDMTYVSKPADQALNDIRALHARHGRAVIRFVDYILPAGYFRTLLPMLQQDPAPLKLTCELKANMTAHRIEDLSAAGFVEIQPGIESFSSSVLREMHKGVSAAQNVLTIKMAMRLGMICHYNFLYGFPGDDAGDYAAMIDRLPALFHLQPPATLVEVLTTRFSPLQEGRVEGVPAATRPHGFYRVVFSPGFLARTGFEMGDYCYYFQPEYQPDPDLRPLYRALQQQVQVWTTRFHARRDAFLVHETDGNGRLTVFDSRGGAAVSYVLSGAAARVYRLVDTAVLSESNLATQLPELGPETLRAALDELRQRALVFEEAGRIVGLALERAALRENYALDMAGTLVS